MNRNVESHFAELPQANIPRSRLDRSSGHMTSFNTSELVPLYVDEILPGDTVSIQSSKVVRLQTLLTPIMSNIYLDMYWFFVPNRLVWDHWREFCGENTESAWIPQTEYTVPKIKSPTGGWQKGTIADYLGIPVNVEMKESKHIPQALPFRAYALICNEFFRDENLTDPLVIPTGDSTQSGSNGSNYLTDVANGGKPFKVAKFHDYFTSCLPSPQKGTPPSIQIGSSTFTGGDFPVYSKPEDIPSGFYPSSGSDAQSYSMHIAGNRSNGDGNDGYFWTAPGSSTVGAPNAAPPNNNYLYRPLNLWANVPDQEISAGAGFSINDLRLAFAAQRFLEKNARGGTRYIEILKQHFGVSSPDARLQRPEYLGGNRVPLSIHSVNNTAQSNEDFLGDLGANSVTADVHFDVNKSFTEHGILMCVACCRYDHLYSQGLNRMWLKDSIYDYYWPTFSNIGEQPVYTDEIFFDDSQNDDVFGYQECWASYRYMPNRISSEMRPNVSGSLASWHLGDNYSEAPVLSDEWIREDKDIVDRVLAVSSEVSNQVFGDFYFKAFYTRPMPVYSIPGLIDHF